jgi:hypothetical protein
MAKNYNKYFSVFLISAALMFLAGIHIGHRFAIDDMKTYLGTVVAKEYQKEEYKVNPETETIEKHEEQYILKVKDQTGSIFATNVSKEEFNQLDIGEKVKR